MNDGLEISSAVGTGIYSAEMLAARGSKIHITSDPGLCSAEGRNVDHKFRQQLYTGTAQ